MLDRVRAYARRARFATTPLHARPTQVRRALGRTRLGRRAKTLRRLVVRHRRQAPAKVLPRRPTRPTGRNVLFVSHCDFTGSSAYHVYSIATELERRGWSPAIAVPGNPRGVRDLGRPAFPVLSFRDVRHGRLRFADGSGPDLAHAFTPREWVRRLTLEVVGRQGCPYVVHLEDNEAAVQQSVVGAYDPAAASGFVAEADGVTAVVDRLLELKPEQVLGAVFWPGYDESIDHLSRSRAEIRCDIGLKPDDIAVVYTGNVHEANANEVGSLYEAVSFLRARGRQVVLVKSGWNSIPPSRLPKLGRGIRDLGWIKRRRVLELLHAADILVQPGAPGPFNDYRFPSKLPDFLASGNPVILPRTNIGVRLEHEAEALVLERGDAVDIAAAIRQLAANAELHARVAKGGRAFAHRELTWPRAGDQVESLYREVLERAREPNAK